MALTNMINLLLYLGLGVGGLTLFVVAIFTYVGLFTGVCILAGMTPAEARSFALQTLGMFFLAALALGVHEWLA
jgi:hypothetical protein